MSEFINEYSELIWVLSGLIPFLLFSIFEATASNDYDFSRDFFQNPDVREAFLIFILLGPFATLLVVFFFLSDLKRSMKMKKIVNKIVENNVCPKCKSSNFSISTDRYEDETSTCVEFYCDKCDLERWGRMDLKDVKELRIATGYIDETN